MHPCTYITAIHAHTPKPLLLCTHKIPSLNLLRTYRTTDNPCHTHSIHAFKNIHRLCHTQYSLHIHIGTSPYQTAVGRHNYIHGPAHNVTSLLQHKHTTLEAQITADTHIVTVYLLSAHIPGHTLSHRTCIRIQHSAQTQHPVHPHDDTPSLPCAPTHALAFSLDFTRGTTHLHHSPAALHTHINTPSVLCYPGGQHT